MKTPNYLQSIFSIILIMSLSISLTAQNAVNGIVTEKNGTPIIGANIFLEGSYDGTITDLDGKFEFNSSLSETQILTITYLGYETKKVEMPVSEMKNLNIQLRESAMSLDAVEITASTFKAGDNSKLAVLKPLDIVTTAGSMGDVVASLKTLPGTSSNAEDGRLFVRGGDARETQIFIDGLKVFSPFSKTVSGTPTRGRYSPFLFQGVSFSTGGYAAEFGQALSGILDMKTTDEPKQTETNISLMTVGVGVAHTQKKNNQSLTLSTSYTDLTPYYRLVKSRLKLKKPFRGFSGEAIYRNKTKKGLFKTYVAGDFQSILVNQYDFETDTLQTIDIDNYNYYLNTNYTSILNDKTSLFAGVSFGVNQDKVGVDVANFDQDLIGVHSKVGLKTLINEHFVINYGIDAIFQQNGFVKHHDEDEFYYEDKIDRTIGGAFIETDYFFSKDLAVKFGLRGEYHTILKKYEVSPRITLAQKIGKNSQMSAAFGQFRQEIATDYLFERQPSFDNEKATHYLVNYNFKNKKQMLRVEGFYKNYDQLLKIERTFGNSTYFNNNGNGYAYGADVFWRANQLVKYLDFWVSYSYLNSERNYLDYPDAAMPRFSTTHNLSIVGKRWIEKLKSQVSFTYSYTSGRPYENPNTTGFLNEISKPFHNMSLSWSYLISQQKILFASVSNFPGFKNDFGYRYGGTTDANGVYPSELVRPNEDRFFFVGFFITMSEDGTKNQLDNL